MATCDKKIPQLEKSKRVEFLLEREFIEQHVALGYTAKAIWKGLFDAGRLTMSYQMFLVLVRRHCASPVLTKNITAKPNLNEKSQEQGSASVTKQEPVRLKSKTKAGLSLNISTIGKEHLLEPYLEENRNE